MFLQGQPAKVWQTGLAQGSDMHVLACLHQPTHEASSVSPLSRLLILLFQPTTHILLPSLGCHTASLYCHSNDIYYRLGLDQFDQYHVVPVTELPTHVE